MSAATTLSEILGWSYFMCWSASFWPQVVLNHRNKSAKGLSLEFTWLNFLGFACYSMYNCALFSIPRVHEDDKIRNHGSPTNLVKINDVAFSLHALIMTSYTLYQIYKYDVDPVRILALWCKTTLIATTVVLGFVFVETLAKNERWDAERGLVHNLYTWLGWFTLVSYVKLGVTCVKYIPQVYLNYSRKSTQGWSVFNVLLDLSGGILSLMQLVVDAQESGDWSAATDNPVKFGLGFVSIGFDVIFCLQHYVWYRKDLGGKDEENDDEAQRNHQEEENDADEGQNLL